jgi:DNA-binding transcriptional regulator PaaX
MIADRPEVEAVILTVLERQGPIPFEELVQLLPAFTWNQVFAAVDRLSREGNLTLRRPNRATYLLSRGCAA